MSWWKKKEAPMPEPADDIEQAREMRDAANAEFRELKRQEPFVQSLTQSLMNRRNLNHFGDAIQITFVRR